MANFNADLFDAFDDQEETPLVPVIDKPNVKEGEKSENTELPTGHERLAS